MTELPKITSVRVERTGVLEIVWRDGVRRFVDVSDKMRGHLRLVELRDPELLARVAVDEIGCGVSWPNGADFCADALRLWGEEQENMRKSA